MSSRSNIIRCKLKKYIAQYNLLFHQCLKQIKQKEFKFVYGLITLNKGKSKGGGATDWRVRHKFLLYTGKVVYASGELKKIQECCNCVDNLPAHIFFFMCYMRYTVLWDFRMDTGGEKDLCLFWE